MLTRTVIVATMSVVLLGSSICQAEVFRWKDKSGKVHYGDQPPTEAQSEQRKLNENTIQTDKQTYASRQATKDFPVTLYTMADCKDECTKARDFLKTRKIPYSEKIMQKQDDVTALRNLLKGQEPMVPTMVVGSKPLVGFESGQWNQALDEAGYTPKSK